MKQGRLGLTAIDIFCGAGGFSHGFYQAGFDIVLGIDNWDAACRTHEINGLGSTMVQDLLNFDINDIIQLRNELFKKYGELDVVIGSPPCTEFSFAKNGGGGNLNKGMLLVRKHLAFVAVLSPKYWLMENVPRLGDVLSKECIHIDGDGWKISYSNLGIGRALRSELGIDEEFLDIPNGKVLNACEFGTRQSRTRFIAGNYPFERLQEMKLTSDVDISLRKIIDDLEGYELQNEVVDPNYNCHKVPTSTIRDHCIRKIHPMHWEEIRHGKRRNIQYGRMDLPDLLDKPSRTVLATYNVSSRESLVLDTRTTEAYQGRLRRIYRHPTVRETASIQGFPLDFQLAAPSLAERYRLIGNAVPCQLSHALAMSISMDVRDRISSFQDEAFLSRARETINRQNKNLCMPILPKPTKILDEANDFYNTDLRFNARSNKHIRRRLLSSKVPRDSSMIILENTCFEGDRMHGGLDWKVCFQNGIGNKYHKVYLDDSSVTVLIDSIANMRIRQIHLRRIVQTLIKESLRGLPDLSDYWDEFKGYDMEGMKFVKEICSTRKKILSISNFQHAFTTDMPDLGDRIGPLDFFDGLDAIALKTFSEDDNMPTSSAYIHVNNLVDNGRYPRGNDSKIIWSIQDKELPFITISTGIMSVCVMEKMYSIDKNLCDTDYHKSLKIAVDRINDWIAG